MAAVQGQETLIGLIDEVLFAVAQTQQRVLVTENVGDFRTLDAQYRAQGLSHLGLILTTNLKYPHQGSAGIGRLIRALEAWVAEHPGEAEADSQLWWL